MFLTGFDATTLNTLWVDKNLKQHGLIQAYSTNKPHSELHQDASAISCASAICKSAPTPQSLCFGDKEAGGIVLLKGYKDYYFGYQDKDGSRAPDMCRWSKNCTTAFPAVRAVYYRRKKSKRIYRAVRRDFANAESPDFL